MTLEEKNRMHEAMKMLKEKGASPSIVGQSVVSDQTTQQALRILKENPKITLEEYMVMMDIEE